MMHFYVYLLSLEPFCSERDKKAQVILSYLKTAMADKAIIDTHKINISLGWN